MKAILKSVLAIGVLALMTSGAWASCPLTQNFTFLEGSIKSRCAGSPYCLILGGSGTASSQTATFWAFGFGNPTSGAGSDSNGYSSGTWLRQYATAGAGSYVTGTWTAAGIDGCIAGQIAAGKTQPIQAILVNDTTAPGFFAVMSATQFNPNALGADFDFDLEGGTANAPSNVTLRAIPKATVKSSVRTAPNVSVTVTGLTLAQLQNAAYGDGGASASDLIKGYKVYEQIVGRGAAAPTNRARSGGWVEASGSNTVFPLGTDATVNVTCSASTNQDTYLAVSIVTDSNFETSAVGANSLPVQCGPTLAEPHFKVIDRKAPVSKHVNPNE